MSELQAMQETIRQQHQMIQNQKYQLEELLTCLQPTVSVTTNSVPVSEVKVAAPEFFTGNRKKTRISLLQLKNVFNPQPSRFSNDAAKVTYTISYLCDAAFM